jgi:addiction module HigA family antidote
VDQTCLALFSFSLALTLGADWLQTALGLTVTDAAQALGVTRTALSRVLNGKAGISPEMSLRLEAWLGVEHGGRAEVWLRMQVAYEKSRRWMTPGLRWRSDPNLQGPGAVHVVRKF